MIGRIQQYFVEPHGVIGLYLTNTCNIICRHCSVESGPDCDTELDVTTILSKISDSIKFGITKGIHVSGGEPFLKRNALSSLGSLCKDLQVALAVNTNGYWATSMQRALAVLNSVDGITQLFLSTDEYHLEFIDIEKIRNAAMASLERGIHVDIGVCTPHGDRDNTFEYIRNAIGENVIAQVNLGTIELESVGRARELAEAMWREKQRSFPSGHCTLLNRPVILENGDISACCNTNAFNSVGGGALLLGNISETSLYDSKLKMLESHFLQAIRTLGPARVAEIIVADPELSAEAQLSFSYLEDNICSLCVDIVKNPRLCNRIENKISEAEDLRIEISVNRAVIYDEIDVLFD